MRFNMSFIGLKDLRDALKQLPAQLKLDATARVVAAAHKAKSELVDLYPDHTGNLKNHVRVEAVAATSQYAARMRVKNTAKHAWIFENGTKARQTKTGASRGVMPKGNVFIPTMIYRREQLHRELVEIVRAAGFQVRG